VNGINKAAGEYYHLVYNDVFHVRACSLRLTNVYGPRQLIRHNRQGFLAWFIRMAVEGGPIEIYGDGTQFRDFVYVDDAADAFLRAGASDACNGDVFNVGGDQPISHRELAATLVDVAGGGRVSFVDWPSDRQAIDIGSFCSDSSRFKRVTGWAPTVDLREGLRRTVAFYRCHLHRYIDCGAQAHEM
jgi:UDP-glucose 4-epimerase